MPEVFTLAKEVIQEVSQLFPNSPFIHLGGDEVSSACRNKRPAIQDFMKANNIASYGQLQMYWRSQLKAILPANKRAIFWRNDGQNVTTSADDILHYWGSQADVASSTSRLI